MGQVHFLQYLVDALSTAGVAQYAVMPHFHKATGQNMLLEAPDKLLMGELHCFDFVAILVIFVRDCYRRVVELQDAMVAQSGFVCVSGQVFNGLTDTPKGHFGVDDPFFLVKQIEQLLEVGGLGQLYFLGFHQMFESSQKALFEKRLHHIVGQ